MRDLIFQVTEYSSESGILLRLSVSPPWPRNEAIGARCRGKPVTIITLLIESRPKQSVQLVDSLNRFRNRVIQLSMRCWWLVCHKVFIYILFTCFIVKFSIETRRFKQDYITPRLMSTFKILYAWSASRSHWAVGASKLVTNMMVDIIYKFILLYSYTTDITAGVSCGEHLISRSVWYIRLSYTRVWH